MKINMEEIKSLDISVTYSVGLNNIKVPADVKKGMDIIYDEYYGELSVNRVYPKDKQPYIDAAIDWLADNVSEGDAFDWEYELLTMED